MYILVLPISGGGFVTQLAGLQHLCEAQFIPDLTLASSGGNVAAYVAAAANWKWPGIERIARELSQDLFIQPWNNITAVSMVMGYFKGAVYDKGSGVYGFLSRHFNSETITKYEIWTGTYNKNRQKALLFCNRAAKDSIMDSSCIDHDLTQSMEPVFANGNVELLAEAGVASASIPAIVPSQRIMGEDYIDGGIAGASPLSIMQEPILKYVQVNEAPLHIIYVNSVDLASPNIKPIHNVLDTWRQATSNLIRSQTVIDRLSGYELLRCHPGVVHKEQFACTYQNLERVKKIRSHIKYSMLEIYPTQRFDIDISKFNGDDIIQAIHTAYKNCLCRFWWISPRDGVCDPTICTLIDECKNCSQ